MFYMCSTIEIITNRGERLLTINYTRQLDTTVHLHLHSIVVVY